METLIEIVHVLVALFMILVVLVQGGNQGGVGAAFGGGNSSGVFGATGATSLLGKLTYGAAFIFMLTSITLTVIQGKSGDVGLKEKLKASTSGETRGTSADTPTANTPGTEANAPQNAVPGVNSPDKATTEGQGSETPPKGEVSKPDEQSVSPESSPTGDKGPQSNSDPQATGSEGNSANQAPSTP